MDRNTIRVLSILGGGARGYLANCLLKNYVKQVYGALTLDNYKSFFSMFDVICGTSIGGIMSLCLALGLTPEDIDTIFLQYGKRIFTSRTSSERASKNHNASLDAAFLTEAEKFASIQAGENFYESPYSDSNYGHNMLYQALTDKFGTKRLSDLKTKVVIPSYRVNNSQFVLFSNFKDDKYFINNNELLTDVAKATSAAPFYFPFPEFGGYKYLDGGLWANDPAEAGILLAKMVKPIHSNIAVLTVSTGLSYWGFGNTDNYDSGDKYLTLSKLTELINISSGGSEQYTSWKLGLQNNRILTSIFGQPLYYHKLDPVFIAELDDFSVTNIQKMSDTANKYFSDNAFEIANSIGHLLG